MKTIGMALIFVASTMTGAIAKPSVVVVPLQAGKDIATTVALKYDKHLRVQLAKTASVARARKPLWMQ